MSKSKIIEMKRITTSDGGTTYIPVRAPEPEPGALAALDSQQMAQMQARQQPTIERLGGSYKDRAIGFSIKTWQVALLFGIIAWLLARIGAGWPLFSIKALLVLAFAAGAVWFAAFALDAMLSPAGVAWYNSRRFWNYMDREQKERFDYWRNVRQN